MVVVKMGDQHVINLADPGQFSCSDNAIGVTAVEAGPPCVNEKGLTGWGHEKRGLAALDVNEIDLQNLLGIFPWHRKRHS